MAAHLRTLHLRRHMPMDNSGLAVVGETNNLQIRLKKCPQNEFTSGTDREEASMVLLDGYAVPVKLPSISLSSDIEIFHVQKAPKARS